MKLLQKPLWAVVNSWARCRWSASWALCAWVSSQAVAQTSVSSGRPATLDEVVIVATRTEVSAQQVGGVVDHLSFADLDRRQIHSLSYALGTLALPVAASGQPGASASIFLRGANSNQTLFLVDGLRFNDPNTDYLVFLGGACVSACDSLEVAHGPQSTLYGGEAVGGVIALRSLRGEGAPSGRLAVEAGAFGTLQGAVAAQGAPGEWAYNLAAQGGRTDNDRVNNRFESGNLTARLDRRVNERIAVGATVRGFQAAYGSPGTRFTNDPDNQERESNWLGTVFMDWIHADDWRSHVVAGGQLRRFVSENPSAGRATQFTVVKNRRAVLDSQTSYTGWNGHRITGGFTVEGNHTRNTGFGDIDRGQSLLAFFAQDEFSPMDGLAITAGLRHDDFDTFGHHITGRASVAWMVSPARVKLRASYGTAFRSPSFLDLYGQSAFYVGNPHLRPERARGGDVGLDFYLAQRQGVIGVTWFENRFTDLIVSDFSRSPSSVVNVGLASSKGAEVSLAWTLPARTSVRLAYTYLEAENRQTAARLLRRPRHSGSADVGGEWIPGVYLGAGLRVVAQREDVHAQTFRTIDGEDYTVARVYATWTLSDRLSLRGRLENALDESYEDVHGYPQLPLGAFASLEWKW